MNYLLEANICITLFYALYLLIFRRLTFVRLNRIYLLASLVMSLCIPLISYQMEETVLINEPIVENLADDGSTPIILPKKLSSLATNATIEKPFDWAMILWTIYGLGVILLSLKLLFFFIKMLKMRRLIKENGYISTKGKLANSSFLNFIFINDSALSEQEIRQIVAHEKWHIQLYHSYDLLLAEIIKIAFWFNPVLWFLQRSLSQIHEYEVDTRMIQAYHPQTYATLLLKLANTPQRLSMAHQFSRKPLTDRIHFLFTKQQSTPMKRLAYLFVLPLLGVLFMAFSFEKIVNYQVVEENSKYFKIVRGETYQMEVNNDMTKVSSLKLGKDEISLAVSYDKVSKELIDEAGKYFKKYGFALQTAMSRTDSKSKGKLTAIDISLIEIDRETKMKQRGKGTYEMSNDGSIIDLNYWRKENKDKRGFISIIANKKTGQHSVSLAQLSIPPPPPVPPMPPKASKVISPPPVPPMPPKAPPAPVKGKTKLSVNNFKEKGLDDLFFQPTKMKIPANMVAIKKGIYVEMGVVKNADYQAFLNYISQDKYFSKKYAKNMIPENWGNIKKMERPVTYISFEQGLAFCEWKTEVFTYQMTKQKKADYATILKENDKLSKKYKFRLPTENEWYLIVKKGLEQQVGFTCVLDLT
jgi:hypothetical protein